MISRHFTTTVSVSRTVWTGNLSDQVIVGTVLAHIQQTSAEDAQVMQQAYGKAHTLWCTGSADVKEGDTLTIATGAFAGTYSVRAVMRNIAIGRNQHLEVVAIKDNV